MDTLRQLRLRRLVVQAKDAFAQAVVQGAQVAHLPTEGVVAVNHVRGAAPARLAWRRHRQRQRQRRRGWCGAASRPPPPRFPPPELRAQEVLVQLMHRRRDAVGPTTQALTHF